MLFTVVYMYSLYLFLHKYYKYNRMQCKIVGFVSLCAEEYSLISQFMVHMQMELHMFKSNFILRTVAL